MSNSERVIQVSLLFYLFAGTGCRLSLGEPGDLKEDSGSLDSGVCARDSGSPLDTDTGLPSDTDSGNADTADTGDTQEPTAVEFGWYFSVHAVEVNYDLADSLTAFEHITALGGTGVRTDIYWKDLEPAQGQWDEETFAFYDDYVSLAIERGVEPMVIVSGAPDWAVALYLVDSAAFWEAFDAYVQRVVERVGDRVTHYQLWNEPNHIIDPIASEDDHLLFSRAGAVIRAVDPDAVFYANALTDIAYWEEAVTDWVEQAADYIDVIGIDHYPGTWSGVDYTDWSPLDTLTRRINDPADPWYGKQGAIMETGYSSWAPWVADEEDQRDWIEQSMPVLRERVVSNNETNEYAVLHGNFYQLIDVDTDGVGQEAHFGILHSNFTEKQGYSALVQQISQF